jgi:hypothetical protein
VQVGYKRTTFDRRRVILELRAVGGRGAEGRVPGQPLGAAAV